MSGFAFLRGAASAVVLGAVIVLASGAWAEAAGERGAALPVAAGGSDLGAVIPAQFGWPPFLQPGSPLPSLNPPPLAQIGSAIRTRVLCRVNAKVTLITRGRITGVPPCPSPH